MELEQSQIYPAFKLVHKHPKRHGVFLWYEKDYHKIIETALFYVYNVPDREIVFFCYKESIPLWKKYIKMFKIKNKTRFYSYEGGVIKNALKNVKHKVFIVDSVEILLRNFLPEQIDLLRKAYKVIALSDNPIRKGIFDLVQIINLVSGRETLPFNLTEFKSKFYSTNKRRSVIYGYLIPLVYFTRNFLGLTVISREILRIIDDKILRSNVLLKVINFLEPKDKTLLSTPSTAFARSGVVSPFGTKIFLKESVVFGILLIVTLFVNIFINRAKYAMEDLRYFDNKRFAKHASPYIINFKNVPQKPKKDQVEGIGFIKYVSYNSYQMNKWINLTQEYVNRDTVKKLDIKRYAQELDLNTYKDNGRIVGNLSYTIPFTKKVVYSPKFHEILKVAKGKKAVFYSNFDKTGICLFKEFLDSQNVGYVYYDSGASNKVKMETLDRFKYTNKFLLLDCNYLGKNTIERVEQLHFIEPLIDLSKKKNIISKMENDKEPQVYTWVSKNTSLIKSINKKIISLKNWIGISWRTFYTFDYNKFSQDVTPDSLVLTDEITYKTQELELFKNINKIKLDPIDCCLKFPNKYQEESCLEKFKSCTKEKKSKK